MSIIIVSDMILNGGEADGKILFDIIERIYEMKKK